MLLIFVWAVAGVKVEPVEVEDGCPACGVVSSRVHAGVEQRVRDVPHAGQVEVVVRKPRLVCTEPACGRRTFTTATEQLPVRARVYEPAEDGAAGGGDRLGASGIGGRR